MKMLDVGWQDSFEIQADAIKPGQTVVVIDDLIATGRLLFDAFLAHGSLRFRVGGSAKAAGELVSKLGGKTLEYLFIIELTFLQAASKLDAPVYSLVQVED